MCRKKGRINTSNKVCNFAFSRRELCCYSFTESMECLFRFIHLSVLTLLKQKGGDETTMNDETCPVRLNISDRVRERIMVPWCVRSISALRSPAFLADNTDVDKSKQRYRIKNNNSVYFNNIVSHPLGTVETPPHSHLKAGNICSS